MEKILSAIIFMPLVTAIILGLFNAKLKFIRIGVAISSLIVVALVVVVVANFNPNGDMQFVRSVPWIQNYGITYFIGVDAISLVILVLITILIPLLYIYIWDESRRGYWYNMMMLQTGVTGAVLSLDLMLFYLFWETMLMPIFILIGRYGSGLNQYNSMKIVLMTILGSMSMLFSILYLGYKHFETMGSWSFAINDLSRLAFDPQTSIWLAAGFLLAFAIKIPLVGFHTWMAPAYNSAPTSGVVILSAIMAKLGVYGLWRFGYGIFDETLSYYAPTIIVLAIIGLLFYAIHAIMEPNLKRMFAYSSGTHLSLIALGIVVTNIYGWGGSLYFIATHALASAGIFLMIGLLYRRTQTINIYNLGGIASVAPRFALFFVFFALCVAGLPGTGGFVGELLIIIGAFKFNAWVGVLSATTMLSAMLYIFWMLQRVIYGSVASSVEGFRDLSLREMVMLSPLVLLLLITGIIPSLFIPYFEPLLKIILNAMGGIQ